MIKQVKSLFDRKVFAIIYLIICRVKYSLINNSRLIKKRDNRIKEDARRSEFMLTLNRFMNKKKKPRKNRSLGLHQIFFRPNEFFHSSVDFPGIVKR